MTHKTSSAIVGLSLLSASLATGGDLSNWRTIPAPDPSSITTPLNSIGTTISYLTSTEAHFYSGITKEWTVFPISNPSFFEQYNAYMVLQDGNQIHGFATRSGVVDTITVSGGAQIVSGPVSSSWVTLVADGLSAWGFSAFLGEWVPLTLTQPNPNMSARRYCGLIQDGPFVYGFSAYHGTFVPVVADAQATILADEEIGVAHSPNVFRAFSVHQNAWGVANVSTAGATLEVGYAAAVSGNTITAFSGLSGTLGQHVASAPPTQITQDAMVIAWYDGTDVIGYAAGQGTFDTLPATAPAALGDYEFVIIEDGGTYTPFSSITGGFGASITGSFSITTGDVIAYADGAVADFAYTPILNQWVAAPPVTEVAAPTVVRSSVCISHATGYSALSARYGTWVPLGFTGGTIDAPSNGATILIYSSGSTASVFDARLNRWADVSGDSFLALQISRHTVIGTDASKAWAFGQPTGRWDSVSLSNSPVVMTDVSSSSGFVLTNAELHTYCVQGSFSWDGRFPEFSRAMKLGNTLRLHQTGPAGSALIMFAGSKPAHLSAGPQFGTLYIDPATMISSALSVVIPPSGLLHLDFPLPVTPSLVGVQAHVQNAVIPPSDPPYLSTSVSLILY